jgi:hypothetical protein
MGNRVNRGKLRASGIYRDTQSGEHTILVRSKRELGL